MIARPHSPDNVVSVVEEEGTKVDQVAIGSCTNSSYLDLMKVAKILKGKTVHKDVSLVIAPGSSKYTQCLLKTELWQTLLMQVLEYSNQHAALVSEWGRHLRRTRFLLGHLTVTFMEEVELAQH